MQIKIYTKAYCSYCYAAKNLLAKRGLEFEEVVLSGDFKVEQEMRDLTGGYTVPQILINGKPIGGYTDLIELDRAGQLETAKITSGP
ncbi:MAG TPA: glutaredoxin domain-containing protein [Xanthomonadales bacterium]